VHLARALFGTTDAHSPQLIEHYADQLVMVFVRLCLPWSEPPTAAEAPD
jgi:hypothetical protein